MVFGPHGGTKQCTNQQDFNHQESIPWYAICALRNDRVETLRVVCLIKELVFFFLELMFILSFVMYLDHKQLKFGFSVSKRAQL